MLWLWRIRVLLAALLLLGMLAPIAWQGGALPMPFIPSGRVAIAPSGLDWGRDGPGEGVSAQPFIYGVSVGDLKNAPRVAELGMGWMKAHISWRSIEPQRGKYQWADLHKAVQAASENNLGLLIRVDQAPDWSHPSNPDPGAPPDPEYLDDWGRFLQMAAARGAGRVQAYEIWNEPNLAVEWGGQPPDPAGYQSLLAAAYRGIKAGDPAALVVSAGLAVTGEATANAVDDAQYLRQLYEAGAAPFFDVLGAHPHAGPDGPEGRLFLKMEQQRRVMEEAGDAHKPVWATEMEWIVRPPAQCEADLRWQARLWEIVDPAIQAQYTVQGFQMIREQWPWMAGIFVFNLDFRAAPWYDLCEPMAYESLLDSEGSPNLAFQALRDMPKPGSHTVPAWVSTLPQGPIIREPSGGGSCPEMWVLADGVRRWLPDIETSLAGGYRIDQAHILPREEVRSLPLGLPIPSLRSGPYPDGLLLKDPATGRIYVMDRSQRRWIIDASTFQYRGFCQDNILDASPIDLAVVPEGVPLNQPPQLAFLAGVPGSQSIHRSLFDGSSRSALTAGDVAEGSPGWALAASRIVFSSTKDGNPEIYTMRSDGTDFVRLTAHPAHDILPTYSSDANRIAFLSDRSGRYQLWMMDEYAMGLKQIAEVPGEVRGYAWSQDGTRIALQVEEAPGRYRIWITSSYGAGVWMVSGEEGEARHPGFSPDGSQIAFTGERDGVEGIYAVGTGGGPWRLLVPARGMKPQTLDTKPQGCEDAGTKPLTMAHPAWSPDGKYIAWLAEAEDGSWSLWVAGSQGQQPKQLLDRVSPAEAPQWAPEAEMLVVSSQRDGSWQIWTVRADGSGASRITSGPEEARSPAWSR